MSTTSVKRAALKPPYERIRVQSSMVDGSLTQNHYLNGVLTSWSPEVQNMLAVTGTSVWMKDVVTPGSKAIRRAGGIINHPMTLYRLNRGFLPDVPVSMLLRDQYGTVGYEISGTGYALRHWLGHFGPAEVSHHGNNLDVTVNWTKEFSECQQLALIKAYGDIKPPETYIGVTLAEAHKTVALVMQTARRFANAIRTLRRSVRTLSIADMSAKDFGREVERVARDVSRDLGMRFEYDRIRKAYRRKRGQGMDVLSSIWLSLRYGWSPLLNDIVTTAAALTLENRSGRFVARGKVKSTGEGSSSKSARFSPNFGLQHYTLSTKIERVTRGYVIYEYEADPLGDPLRRFGITHPLSTLWELMPWSFVVDWFINVGDWLLALESKVGVKILATGVTTREDATYQRIVGSYVKDGPNQFDDPGWESLEETHTSSLYRREVNLSLPQFPQLNVRVNPKRAIDAIALLAQAGGRKWRT